MSKYADLAQTIESAIESGEYPKGSRLPTTPELCKIYQVSNTTVKRAMDQLEQQGLVARRRGSGIYVKSLPVPRGGTGSWSMSGQMTGSTAEYAEKGIAVTSIVNDFSVIHPNEMVAENLNVSTESFVYYICRTRVVEGVPKNVEYTFMPIDVIPGLHEGHLYGSIYQYIEHDLDLKIASAHRILRAVVPTEDEVTWLALEPGQPLLEVRQVGFLDDGTPFEFSTTRHTCDYEFRLVSTR